MFEMHSRHCYMRVVNLEFLTHMFGYSGPVQNGGDGQSPSS
ncbi:MAG: hypothetical protein QOD40_2092 [Alphaproteobacteria bacterium]|jgi:hypothetical protein|nr:hypothetical protein [Alphaproteobacteria bacterium]